MEKSTEDILLEKLLGQYPQTLIGVLSLGALALVISVIGVFGAWTVLMIQCESELNARGGALLVVGWLIFCLVMGHVRSKKTAAERLDELAKISYKHGGRVTEYSEGFGASEKSYDVTGCVAIGGAFCFDNLYAAASLPFTGVQGTPPEIKAAASVLRHLQQKGLQTQEDLEKSVTGDFETPDLRRALQLLLEKKLVTKSPKGFANHHRNIDFL